MTAFVLLVYLSASTSAKSGMATMTAEYTSAAKCGAAGKAAKNTFGGLFTGVYYVCTEK